ncbi:MAG: HlyC/CorC family transporter [Nitratireductor sp.]|nr:HlyC/CorC family transporter [Nitratireductor sp.]
MSSHDTSQSPARPEAETSPEGGSEDGDPSRSETTIHIPDDPAEDGAQNGAGGGLITRLLAPMRRSGKTSIREGLSDALAQQDVAGSDISPEERVMLNNILKLQEVRVEDLMVPRADIEATDLHATLGELLLQFETSGHSRMPVYDETLDDPRGMIHIRDLVAYITKQSGGRRRNGRNGPPKLDLTRVDLDRELGKTNLVRKVIFVPPSMMAADLMARMQATRMQMALVIDEYGGTEGLLSLEDIVEIIVGNIEDEHDDEEELIRPGDDGTMMLDARAEIDDIREALGGRFHVGDHDDDAETIGGVIFSLLGRVPVKGEVIDAFGYEFRIRDADPRRIKLIQMVPSKKPQGRKAKNAN